MPKLCFARVHNRMTDVMTSVLALDVSARSKLNAIGRASLKTPETQIEILHFINLFLI